MSVKWYKKWTTDDFIAYCDKLEDRDTAFLLKEYVSNRVYNAETRAKIAEQKVSDYSWEEAARNGWLQDGR